MSRYLVERTFPDGLHIPTNAAGAQACLAAAGRAHHAGQRARSVLLQLREET